MRKKFGFFLTISILSVILNTFLVGCSKQVDSKDRGDALDIVQLEKREVKDDDIPANTYIFNNIAQIISGNNEGELLGLLWANTKASNPILSEDLYLIDPAASYAQKVFTPQAGYRIFDAVLDKDWIAISVQSKTQWIIHLVNRHTNELKVLCSGDYFIEGGGPDYPSLALHKGILAYNTSIKISNSMLSKIELINLETGQFNTVKQIYGYKQYLGPPSIYEDFLVFHRGEWTEKMNSEVYLYDIESKNLKQISQNQMAVKPSIWGKYVVWSGYSPDTPEIKNIVLYNLETDKCATITDASPENRKEYWAVSISHGIVTWSCNFENKPSIYSTSSNELRSFEVEGQQASVRGSWFTWRNPKASSGTYIAGLSAFFPVLDLSGVSSNFTNLSFSLDNVNQETVKSMTPPESLALYYSAYSNKRFDIIDQILSHQGELGNRNQAFQELKANWVAPGVEHKVSTDYFIEGNTAYVGENTNSSIPVRHHLTKEDGVWKVDWCSNQ